MQLSHSYETSLPKPSLLPRLVMRIAPDRVHTVEQAEQVLAYLAGLLFVIAAFVLYPVLRDVFVGGRTVERTHTVDRYIREQGPRPVRFTE